MRSAFMSISAAEGNLGDIAIRREVIDQMRQIGLRPVIYLPRARSDSVPRVGAVADLAQAGVEIVDATTNAPTLDDVFLALARSSK